MSYKSCNVPAAAPVVLGISSKKGRLGGYREPELDSPDLEQDRRLLVIYWIPELGPRRSGLSGQRSRT